MSQVPLHPWLSASAHAVPARPSEDTLQECSRTRHQLGARWALPPSFKQHDAFVKRPSLSTNSRRKQIMKSLQSLILELLYDKAAPLRNDLKSCATALHAVCFRMGMRMTILNTSPSRLQTLQVILLTAFEISHKTRRKHKETSKGFRF